MLREAELGRLRRVLRADRGRPAALRWAPTATWELARAAGLFRRFLRAPKNAG